MDLSDFLNSGWESVLVVLGIVGVIINFLSKAGKGTEEENKKAPQPRPNLRSMHQASRTQTTKKPENAKCHKGHSHKIKNKTK